MEIRQIVVARGDTYRQSVGIVVGIIEPRGRRIVAYGHLDQGDQRPLNGDTPTIELVLGYKKSNKSPILKLLLSRVDELVARASNKTR